MRCRASGRPRRLALAAGITIGVGYLIAGIGGGTNFTAVLVGVGLVAGSTAEAEWRETEMKSLAMLRALGGGDVVRR